jgi:hypothetical protein
MIEKRVIKDGVCLWYRGMTDDGQPATAIMGGSPEETEGADGTTHEKHYRRIIAGEELLISYNFNAQLEPLVPFLNFGFVPEELQQSNRSLN